jgi:transcription elongation factor GreA
MIGTLDQHTVGLVPADHQIEGPDLLAWLTAYRFLAAVAKSPAHKELDVTDTATPAASYLTQEAYDRLKGELDELSGEGRTEISKKIEAARDEGDLKENGGYHAAKEEQGKMEARIRLLTQLLENATVGHAPPDDGIVEPGMVVTVELAGEEMTFLLGSREIAGNSDLEVYSEKSPLGKAILALKAGDMTSFRDPKGNEVKVKVLHAKPCAG